MAYYYLKLYHEILDDPKMGRLSDHLYRRVIELFLIASASNDRDGYLPSIEEIAWKLRSDESSILIDLQEIEKTGIIKFVDDNWLVTNFVKRQSALTTTERTREFKKREQIKDTDRKSGIYKIECVENGKVYIGASVDINRRITVHFSEGKSFRTHWMHEDLLTYSKHGFTCEVLEIITDQSKFAERETYWIKQYPIEKLYNNEKEGKNHRDWERLENDSFQESSAELRVKDIVKDRESHSGDEFHQMQVLIETLTGYPVPPTSDSVKAINEFIKWGVIEDDLRDALTFLGNNGKIARGPVALLGSVKTAVAKRTQRANASKPYIPEEHASEVY